MLVGGKMGIEYQSRPLSSPSANNRTARRKLSRFGSYKKLAYMYMCNQDKHMEVFLKLKIWTIVQLENLNIKLKR